MTERWLARITEPLDAVAKADGRAAERLTRWLDLLVGAKQRWALEEPELFETYVGLTAESREVVAAPIEHITGQLARIIADGVTQDNARHR